MQLRKNWKLRLEKSPCRKQLSRCNSERIESIRYSRGPKPYLILWCNSERIESGVRKNKECSQGKWCNSERIERLESYTFFFCCNCFWCNSERIERDLGFRLTLYNFTLDATQKELKAHWKLPGFQFLEGGCNSERIERHQGKNHGHSNHWGRDATQKELKVTFTENEPRGEPTTMQLRKNWKCSAG